MPNFILQCFYFILPAYFANMAPVILKNFFRKLAFPIDLNKKINNKPIFGINKTYRGVIFGIIFAIFITFLQYILYKNNIFFDISIVDYSNWLLLGFLLGFGAIIGDLMESFVKRRLNYPPGKPFVPFDQLDFVIGALIFVAPIVILSISKIITILLLTFVLHILINHIAFYTNVRQEKW